MRFAAPEFFKRRMAQLGPSCRLPPEQIFKASTVSGCRVMAKFFSRRLLKEYSVVRTHKDSTGLRYPVIPWPICVAIPPTATTQLPADLRMDKPITQLTEAKPGR